MSCQYAKRYPLGKEKPYNVCLHPDVKMCKCRDEELCPLKMTGASRVEEENKEDPIEEQPDLFWDAFA